MVPSGSCVKKMLTANSRGYGTDITDHTHVNIFASDVENAYYYQNNQYHVALTKPFGLYRPSKQ